MTAAANTPGFNCRVRIYFTTAANGKRRARYISPRNPFRSFPLPLIDAELFVAQELADVVPGPLFSKAVR